MFAVWNPKNKIMMKHKKTDSPPKFNIALEELPSQ